MNEFLSENEIFERKRFLIKKAETENDDEDEKIVHKTNGNLKNSNQNKKEEEENFEQNHNKWRYSYFNLLKDSIQYEETIKNLIEENRIHQEYIINLENKYNNVLKKFKEITDNLHNNFINGRENSAILEDYRKQLEILADEKDNLLTTNSMLKHQNLQTTLKLEETQNRLFSIQKEKYESEINNN